MFKLYKILFFNSMLLGTLISISAYSWFNMWIGLEINLLSILPLLKSNKNTYPAEASLKYFITQALASTIILFAVILSLISSEYIPNNSDYWLMMILNSALLTKLGAAPFHTWFPEVMEGLNWMNNLILLTWQKLAPMILIMYNLKMMWFLMFIIITSSLIGGILGLNQTSLRKIMAYSSINHISWMLASMMNFKLIWFSYFIIYSMISLNIIFIFYKMNIFTLNQLFYSLNSNKLVKLFFIMNFLSLGGLPPFLGFLPKWIVINNLILSQMYVLSLILIISTLITLYFYIRLTFSSLTIMMTENLVKFSKMSNFLMLFLNSLTLLSLFLCTSIFNIL
uniref:NADH dehydrogenase subunit 2 n=1 Tax=Galerucella nipponensis TaxID=416328 RepID=UPI002027B223|nr:NADH dehydrogenase subunit 2 [Galerucella nipponensis]YP_010483412.1 NADH dehydrogenase subunit 2 [Galerucella birmanica]UQJ77619.1 NADH dehydrogenase subunit 2 [Galerucella nipponensis]UVV35472.1 NADH dehydrogenase subunit 2 [Galerucella birmanica]